MNTCLKHLPDTYNEDKIILICDGTPWYKSKTLGVPQTIRIVYIPPYTPKMNSVEQIWKEIRKRGFRNGIFKTFEKVVDRFCDTIC